MSDLGRRANHPNAYQWSTMLGWCLTGHHTPICRGTTNPIRGRIITCTCPCHPHPVENPVENP